MKYLSICSGIEAASVAWQPLGWEAVAFSEIEPFPSAVLAHHYPNVPNLGDMTKYEEWPEFTIDLVCGGTPCQAFSIAGQRGGLDDPRGNLMLTFGHILAKYRPKWFVWENVPGVLSSNNGRDFASFLGLVTGQSVEPPADGWRSAGCLGGIDSAYGVSWRILDAQFTRTPSFPRAVPQRRQRVWVVGHLGDWRRAAAVLFDGESLSGYPPPRRETGQAVAGDAGPGVEVGCADVAGALTGSGRGTARTGESRGQDPIVGYAVTARESGQGYWMEDDIAGTIDANMGMSGHKERPAIIATVATQECAEVAPTLSASGTGTERVGFNSEDQSFVAMRQDAPDVAQTVLATESKGIGHNREENLVAVAHTRAGEGFDASEDGTGRGTPIVPIAFSCKDYGADAGKVSPTLRSMNESGGNPNGGGQVAVVEGYAVRRLTPEECERLQGFPTGWTRIPWRKKPAEQCPDGPRYKAIGNSWATNCAEWIGIRIQMMELVYAGPYRDRAEQTDATEKRRLGSKDRSSPVSGRPDEGAGRGMGTRPTFSKR